MKGEEAGSAIIEVYRKKHWKKHWNEHRKNIGKTLKKKHWKNINNAIMTLLFSSDKSTVLIEQWQFQCAISY